jgi:predicted KAP-like P-loop ATPase
LNGVAPYLATHVMISNDTPISDPQEDRFEVSPFAQAIARSIEKLSAPEGTVIAITGPWGSRKSSVVGRGAQIQIERHGSTFGTREFRASS